MKTLNLEDHDVFDQWRENYWEMTSQDHKEFSIEAAKKWPSQKHFNISNFCSEIQKQKNCTVLEIGGWKGEMAHEFLSQSNDIKKWLNIDFCPVAKEQSVVKDPRYFTSCPEMFTWFKGLRADEYDVCVSAHMIEHLSDDHFIELVNFISGIPVVIFEAPLQDAGNDWTGDISTHILEMGWNGVDEVMSKHGYRRQVLNQGCHLYRL